MIFELWDVEGGGLVGAWDSEAEALAVVRANLDAFGPAYLAPWVLLRDDDPERELVVVAEGAALVELARSAEPATAD
jgi:hypothetical protein